MADDTSPTEDEFDDAEWQQGAYEQFVLSDVPEDAIYDDYQ